MRAHLLVLSSLLLLGTGCDDKKGGGGDGSSGGKHRTKTSATASAGGSGAASSAGREGGGPRASASAAVETPTASPSATPSASAAATGSGATEPAAVAGTSSGFDSAEALVKALVEAMHGRDGAKAKAVFPTDAVLDRIVGGCAGPDNFKDKTHSELGRLAKELDGAKWKTVEYVGVEEKPDKQVKKGGDFMGCKANEDFETVGLRAKAKIDGKEDSEGMTALKAGGKYFLVDM